MKMAEFLTGGDMKRIYIALVLMIVPLCSFAQDILDNVAHYRAEYSYLYKKDSTKAGYYKDIYYLDICKSGHSYFYSRAANYKDSVKTALFAQGEHWAEVAERIRPLPSGLKWNLDKRFVEGKYHYTNRLSIHFYRAIEDLQMPQWELQPDTLTIGGWLCHKAVATVGGRVWEAWYAPQIPISDGPWLLWGLPGLIVFAKDSKGYFKFRCESVGQLAEPYLVFLPDDNNPVKTMDIKSLIKAECLAETDLDKFDMAFSGAISASSSAPLPKQYYIPLYLVK